MKREQEDFVDKSGDYGAWYGPDLDQHNYQVRLWTPK